MLKILPMGKYTTETVKNIPDTKIAQELLIAQQENIAKANPDVQLIMVEITRRLQLVAELTEENARLRNPTSESGDDEYPAQSGNY